MNLNQFAQEVHANAIAHGWWDTDRDLSEIISLIHSEWSEALEQYRDGRPMHYYIEYENGHEQICTDFANHDGQEPEGIAVELIDGCIRILDFFGKHNRAFIDASYEREVRDDRNVVRIIAKLHRCTSWAYRLDEPFQCDFYYLGEAINITFAWLRKQGLDPEAIMIQKHEYNKTRERRHGGKVC